ncbi:DUF2189 domain-containing protein [Comamonas terrigena]|uniref:DUF2189 domain-containing protein n=1 Tax=Comamonas terrigena TaxID=32013 RepID=UPI00244D2EBA|nr:DUF2189 domain-containing protein [Comamonas terrigena]MDH1704212.1 DUF2189 domain-containing protein [Comamonas terrigena]
MPGILTPTATVVLPTVRSISMLTPLEWLALGWKDICRAPWLSLAHGVFLTLVGLAILALGHNRFWLMAGALSGFLIVGPVVATSLYAISRALERGEAVSWQTVRSTWARWQSGRGSQAGGYWCLVRFGLLLALAATGWVVVSASLITVLSPVRIATPMDFLQQVVMAPDGRLFTLWLGLGSVLAAPIFASSVVAMPLLLDRRIGVFQAVLTSWLVVVENPVAMAWWAGLILLFTLLGLGSLLIGLVLVMPMLGHASWHAYRALVDASAFEARGPSAAEEEGRSRGL